jgi:hypothetical protein
LDEGFKTSSYLTETLLDPQLGHSSEANKAAFNKAYNTEDILWNWLERPDHKLRLVRFGAAMTSVRNSISPNAILEGSVMLRGFEKESSDFDISKIWQGTPGKISLQAHWSSMLEAVLAHSH